MTLSNIGDVILTCPGIDVLLHDFPQARVSVIVSPKAAGVFAQHPGIRTIIFDKHAPWSQQVKWFLKLRAQSFDCIIDFRQSALALFLPCRFRTSVFPTPFKGHERFKHLERLKSVYPQAKQVQERLSIIPKPLPAAVFSDYVLVAPGAADAAKRWGPSGFVEVANELIGRGHNIILCGDAGDQTIIRQIQKELKGPSLAFGGHADLRQLAFLIKGARFAIVHDSAPLHMAGYFDVPVIALWGATDHNRYGPWSSRACLVRRGGRITSITTKDVVDAIDQMR